MERSATQQMGTWSETASFVDDEAGGHLFSCLHRPVGAVRGTLLICSPLHAEFAKNYRREVELARLLSGRGFAVQRFHYRGTGHSSGDAERVSFATMLDDARQMYDRLRRCADASTPTAVLGTRLAAHVAVALAGERRLPTVALWEPSVNVGKHFRAVFRAGIVRELKQGSVSGADRRQFSLDGLRERGSSDVLGYPITATLVEEFLTLDLRPALLSAARAVQILQFGERGEGRPDQAALARDLLRAAIPVDVSVVGAVEPWWFGGGGDRWDATMEMTGEVALTCADWISERCTSRTYEAPV